MMKTVGEISVPEQYSHVMSEYALRAGDRHARNTRVRLAGLAWLGCPTILAERLARRASGLPLSIWRRADVT